MIKHRIIHVVLSSFIAFAIFPFASTTNIACAAQPVPAESGAGITDVEGETMCVSWCTPYNCYIYCAVLQH